LCRSEEAVVESGGDEKVKREIKREIPKKKAPEKALEKAPEKAAERVHERAPVAAAAHAAHATHAPKVTPVTVIKKTRRKSDDDQPVELPFDGNNNNNNDDDIQPSQDSEDLIIESPVQEPNVQTATPEQPQRNFQQRRSE